MGNSRHKSNYEQTNRTLCSVYTLSCARSASKCNVSFRCVVELQNEQSLLWAGQFASDIASSTFALCLHNRNTFRHRYAVSYNKCVHVIWVAAGQLSEWCCKIEQNDVETMLIKCLLSHKWCTRISITDTLSRAKIVACPPRQSRKSWLLSRLHNLHSKCNDTQT